MKKSGKFPNRNKLQWIDISIPLKTGIVHWPGDPAVTISRTKDMNRGDSTNLSMISMGAHSGTHVDAPIHFIRGGTGVDEVLPERMVGRARVIEIMDNESITPGELIQHGIRRGERILFKTRNSSHVWQRDEFVEDFVFISEDAAHFLVKRGVRMVGVDYLSVGSYRHGGSDVHRILLSVGICIIEGLNLWQVVAGRYYLICLPLRIVQSDGAPARAIIRPIVS